jgi:adenosylcobyric acid synthase
LKALSVLGTSSNSGKSWLATALCAWLRRRGVRVAPFKAQNMSNNSFATLDGGEIGRAQAVQAEACGLTPIVQMNPILLKPSGSQGSQLILLGKPQRHLRASEYYKLIDELWLIVRDTLEYWRDRCDVLILEGAGSPVELNLMRRDLVNLRPVHYLNGRSLLVADIERGGVFAQIVGTWTLLNPADRDRFLGVVVNKFRGDISLFADAPKYLAEHVPVSYLGVLPYLPNLQPESEDSLCREAEESPQGEKIAWLRLPYLANSQDCQPWLMDEGIQVQWVDHPSQLADARIIILPGSKNTIADLDWLRRTKLDAAIQQAASRGIPVVGICGGYQILGEWLRDPEGVAGDRGVLPGLNLLPIQTTFSQSKSVSQVVVRWGADRWSGYEIHMGVTDPTQSCSALAQVENGQGVAPEGCRRNHIWGSYLHGLFESPEVRSELAALAGLKNYSAGQISWRTHLEQMYDRMADALEEHLETEEIWKYVAA